MALVGGDKVIRFIERHTVHPEGRWIGKPFLLEAWQKQMLRDLYTVDQTGRRKHRWAYLSTSKKSGKTSLAAALALYHLIADGEPSPLVVCAASSEDQADLVYGSAKRMCELSPTLSQITERYEREILVPSIPGARLKRLAAVAGANDGPSISFCVLDELHEWTGPKLEACWNVLTNGTGARLQPLILQATTAGYDLDSICGRQYEHAKQVISGELQDPRYFARIWEAPADLDYHDPAAWRAANPNLGITVEEDFYRDQLGQKTAQVFRRYFANTWTETAEAWLPEGAWNACYDPTADLDQDLPLYVGCDVSLGNDSTAVVAVQRQGEKFVTRCELWENPFETSHPQFSEWRVPLEEVHELLRNLYLAYPTPATEIDGELTAGPMVVYDPSYFELSAQQLRSEGVAMVSWPQSLGRMVPACTGLYAAIVGGNVAHDGDAALARHINNAQPKVTDRGIVLQKRNRRRRLKIDAAIALALAVAAASMPTPEPHVSVYEYQPLRVLGDDVKESN